MDKNQYKSSKVKEGPVKADNKKAEEIDKRSLTTDIGKYLTDMKELPPVTKEPEEKKTKTVLPAKENNLSQKPSQIPTVQNPDEKKENKIEETSEEEVKLTPVFTFKDVILGAINFISIVLLIFLLTKLPGKAKEFQTEKLTEVQNLSNPQAEFRNLDQDSKKADSLDKLFLDESGIVNFVGEVEKLKAGGGSISKVTFASQRGVKDLSGTIGIPVIIELRGNWQTIGADLEKIQGLPFLFRPVSIDAGPAKDDPSVVILSYGGFLYVNEKEVPHE